MTEPGSRQTDLRTDLIAGLRASRGTEREVFAALEPADRDTPSAGGSWSAKDVQAHLAAWRRRQVERLVALREGRDEPALASMEIDEINAIFHEERADWTWDRVVADAEAATDELVAEVESATTEVIARDRIVGAVMGNGPEHSLAHLPAIAGRVGLGSRVTELAMAVQSTIDRGGWPPRSAAFARYNLACFHALGGRLEVARSLLRQALAGQDELQALAPVDDDLIALRDEIRALLQG